MIRQSCDKPEKPQKKESNFSTEKTQNIIIWIESCEALFTFQPLNNYIQVATPSPLTTLLPRMPGVTCLRLYCPLLSQLGMCRAYRSSRGPRLSLKGILDIRSRTWSSSCWHWVLKAAETTTTKVMFTGPHCHIWACHSRKVPVTHGGYGEKVFSNKKRKKIASFI